MRRWQVVPCLLVVGLALAAGCDNTFEPTSPGGPPFSVFGYLDATADTQWIRVNPLRSVLLASAQPTGARVSLEDLATGQHMLLREVARKYPTVLDTVYAHDFWTTERLRYGATYRFRAEARDGAVTESLVRVPRDIHLEVWELAYPFTGTPQMHVEGLSHLAFAIWTVTYVDGCNQSKQLRYVDRTAWFQGDSTGGLVNSAPRTDLMERCGGRASRATQSYVQVVSSADPWPTGQGLSVWRLAPEENASNVAGGVGFLGGVVTRSTRVETCSLPWPAAQRVYCKLRYDSTTATLRGRVLSRCALGLDNLAVQLRELNPPAGEFARTRTGSLTPAFDFDIGALRPGIRHELTVTPDTILFMAKVDTLTFQAGQTTHYDAWIEPRGPCP